MIESICISNIASYNSVPENLRDLSKFNFIFGSNSSGKTTISRVIADEISYQTCRVNWKNGVKLETLVYNQDFIRKNFNQSDEIKGIFTLGEDSADTIKKISAEKDKLKTAKAKYQSLNEVLEGDNGSGGKKGELDKLEGKLINKCWAQERKYKEKFTDAFKGYRNDGKKFMGKILKERASNSEKLESLANLETKAKIVFGQIPTHEDLIPDIEIGTVIAQESNPILKRCIIGKKDVDIAGMIEKLGNSDWVQKGSTYYKVNNKVCPFCQQKTTDSFANSLNDYFDETFERETRKIDELEKNYIDATKLIQNQLASIIDSPSKYLDFEKMDMKKDLLDSIIEANIQHIGAKKKEPSQVIELTDIKDVISEINILITDTNVQITEHNKTVTNLKQEKQVLTSQVWKYLLEVELKEDLKTYKTEREMLEETIKKTEERITTTKNEMNETEARIRGLEKQTTSLQPTIDGINSFLSDFGFQDFSLAKAENGPFYKLIRRDGSDAKETLSEGERSFLTFLYFYHLLKGSDSKSGMTTDRVVVFDDPVSSLDSDILFIVSSLLKDLFKEVRSGTGHIKQIFVMTHNVYFHKEVTFNPKRQNKAMNEETFWIVRKYASGSKLSKHDSNPIKTSYDLLWEELRQPNRSNLTIQNTLRRILENYFKILGGIGFDEIIEMFEGKEKIICKSLISWVHDGSHNVHDNLYVSIDDPMVERYLNVFKEIFDKSGHSAHYNMMMGDVNLDSSSGLNAQ